MIIDLFRCFGLIATHPRHRRAILKALWVTVNISMQALVLGTALGAIICLLRICRGTLLQYVVQQFRMRLDFVVAAPFGDQLIQRLILVVVRRGFVRAVFLDEGIEVYPGIKGSSDLLRFSSISGSVSRLRFCA